jgi:hypothetical protein
MRRGRSRRHHRRAEGEAFLKFVLPFRSEVVSDLACPPCLSHGLTLPLPHTTSLRPIYYRSHRPTPHAGVAESAEAEHVIELGRQAGWTRF